MISTVPAQRLPSARNQISRSASRGRAWSTHALQLNPHSARFYSSALLPAISCLGASRTLPPCAWSARLCRRPRNLHTTGLLGIEPVVFGTPKTSCLPDWLVRKTHGGHGKIRRFVSDPASSFSIPSQESRIQAAHKVSWTRPRPPQLPISRNLKPIRDLRQPVHIGAGGGGFHSVKFRHTQWPGSS